MHAALRMLAIAGKLALSFLVALVITLLAMIPVVALLGLTGGGEVSLQALLDAPFFLYGSMIAQAAGFTGAVVLMVVWFERKAGWKIGWRQQGAVRKLFEGAGLGIVLMSAIFLAMLLVGAVRIEGGSAAGASISGLAWYLLLFALVSLNEELFSRGYVQGLLRHHYGPVAAVLCSSLLFALLHSFNPGALDHPLPLINLFVAGVLLGVSREVSGGLWLPIGLHWTWNFVQGNVYGFEVSGTEVPSLLHIEPSGAALWSGGSFGAEGSLIATLLMTAAIWLLWKNRQKGGA